MFAIKSPSVRIALHSEYVLNLGENWFVAKCPSVRTRNLLPDPPVFNRQPQDHCWQHSEMVSLQNVKIIQYEFSKSCHRAYIAKCLMTFITFRKTHRKRKCVATPSQPQVVDVVHVTSLLEVIIIIVVGTLVFIDLCCSTKLLPWVHYILNMPPLEKDLIATCGFKGKLYGSFA